MKPFQKKSEIGVKDAARLAFLKMSDNFNGVDFVKRCKKITHRPFSYADTYFRRLRELRAEGICNYKCKPGDDSQYQKV